MKPTDTTRTRSGKFPSPAVRYSLLTLALGMALASGLALAADPPAHQKKGDWTMWGGSTDRNMVSDETGMPLKWDIKSKKNIKWSAPLGSQTYGNCVVAGGKVFVGSNNEHEYRPKLKGDKGTILCFDEKDGKFLWQATHDKLAAGRVNDWPEQGICSTGVAENGKFYYVSNRCELICADVNGFLDGKNDGPFKDEQYHEKEDADFIWVLDMIDELGVFPHNLAASSPVIGGDLVFILTSNGVDEGHLNIPSPDAPDFIAVDKNTGKVAWEKNQVGKKIFHGQWSSPAYGMVQGKPQVIFGGGDGVAYAYEPKTGELLWHFNLNPPGAKYVLGGRGTANEIISTPVIHDDKVFLCVGQDPEHGEGIGHLYCIDAAKRGDITESGKVWHVGGEDFHRSISTCAIRDGLLYCVDLSGFLNCLDVKTGQRYWKHDTFSAIWGSPYYVDGRVYLGTEDGEVLVFKHGKEKKLLATNDMGNSVYTTPVAANGTLFVNNRNTLYAIVDKGEMKGDNGDKSAMK